MEKDPSARKDYGFNWGTFLGSSDSIISSVYSAGTCTVTSMSVSSLSTAAYISGGVAGETHRVTNRIESANGIIDERSFELKIIEL